MRDRFRAGFRPALYAGASAAVISLFMLPMLGEHTTGDAIGAVALNFVAVGGMILLLYLSGIVKPTDRKKAMPVNPWIVAVLALTLGVALWVGLTTGANR